MPKIRICHLYPDFLNLYGDFGNILALNYRAKLRNIDVEYHKITIGDKLKPGDYDFFFIGGGQDAEQTALIDDLIFHKKSAIQEAFRLNKTFLCICGGYQLLGKYFETKDHEMLQGVDIFPVTTKGQSKRLIGDIVCEANWLGEGQERFLFGFENHSGCTYFEGNANPLAKTIIGFGNNDLDKLEGCRQNNAFGTYMHGSFLPKNPQMTDYLLNCIFQTKFYDQGFILPEAGQDLENRCRMIEARRLGLDSLYPDLWND